jgi:hypothetical protein
MKPCFPLPGRGGGFSISRAVLAVSIQFQFVFPYPESLLPGNPLLQSFQAIIFEFLDLPAAQTDQVVVMLSLNPVFKAGGAISKPAGGSPTALRQEPQGAIDRGVPDARVSPPHPLIEFVDRHMRIGFPQSADDLVPLAGGLKPPLPQKMVKGIFRQSFPDVKN